MGKGYLITIEGVEGVGKSTNLAFLENLLRDRGISFITTREPGGTPLGEEIRQLLLDKNQTQMTSMTELLLMFAARVQHIETLIQPALASGKWVICDRFTDSSYAYQGGGRGIPYEEIQRLEKLVLKGFAPDLTLLLDLPARIGLARAGERSDPDRFEREDDEFFNQVRQAFLQRAEAEQQRFRIIDASQPLEAVQAQIATCLDAWFQHRELS